jgi:hypothetical protein
MLDDRSKVAGAHAPALMGQVSPLSRRYLNQGPPVAGAERYEMGKTLQ